MWVTIVVGLAGLVIGFAVGRNPGSFGRRGPAPGGGQLDALGSEDQIQDHPERNAVPLEPAAPDRPAAGGEISGAREPADEGDGEAANEVGGARADEGDSKAANEVGGARADEGDSEAADVGDAEAADGESGAADGPGDESAGELRPPPVGAGDPERVAERARLVLACASLADRLRDRQPALYGC
jgi:hypothetical protein